MLRTVEAVTGPDGSVRLLEPVSLSEPRRALVTVRNEESRRGGTGRERAPERSRPSRLELRRGGCRLGAFAADAVVQLLRK